MICCRGALGDLVLPLLVGYALYRIVAYAIAISPEGSQHVSFWESYSTLPGLQTLFGEIAWDALLLVTVLVLFFLAVRRTVARTTLSVASRLPGEGGDKPRTGSVAGRIEALLRSADQPPQRRALTGRDIDVFVSGHTHAPALSRITKEPDGAAVVVNSGCWLRQLRPVPAHLGQPPVFVPEFVQTHARVYLDGQRVVAELWEHPGPAPRRLRVAERLAVLGRLPAQPPVNAKPRFSARGTPPDHR